MFRNNVYSFKNLPVEDKERKRTDCICTICSALFALTLFILSFIFFRRGKELLIKKTITRLISQLMMQVRLALMTILHNLIFIFRTLTIYLQEDIVYPNAQELAKLFNVQMKIL